MPFSRSIVELGGLERVYLLIVIAYPLAEKGLNALVRPSPFRWMGPPV